jgi:DNA-binding NtrC family response regulator
MECHKVLIVEDEPLQSYFLTTVFRGDLYKVERAATVAQACQAVDRFQPDVILLDYQLPDGTASDVLRCIKRDGALPPVIIVTSSSSIELAVNLVKEGADQFLVKPVDPVALLALCERTLDQASLHQARRVPARTESLPGLNPFYGISPAIRALETLVKRLLAVEVPILLHGETGTGKTALARWIHQQTRRREHAFVEMNCAGLSRELLESELFGHEKGAFTGASAAKVGMIELADRGTLFLDEIADMDLQVQAKILKVIEEKTFHRLGDTRFRAVTFGLIGATHQSLEELLPTGRFREDLYYRISTIQLTLPALRERQEDIPMLARLFLSQTAAQWGVGPIELSAEAEDLLRQRAWPGNIRELRSALEGAILGRRGPVLEAGDFSLNGTQSRTRSSSAPLPAATDLSLEEMERRHILQVLEATGFKVDQAAVSLGIHRNTLYTKLKHYGVAPTGIAKEGPNSRKKALPP